MTTACHVSSASLDGSPPNSGRTFHSCQSWPHSERKPLMRRISPAAGFVLFSLSLLAQQKSDSRHFVFDYSFTVKISDPGKPLDVWFPMAHSDHFQQIKILSQKSDLPLKETTESEYENRMFYAHADKATKPEYHFSVKYDVVRLEHRDAPVSLSDKPGKRELARFLQPDKLVPITGKPAQIALEQVKPGMTDIEKARALYDYT